MEKGLDLTLEQINDIEDKQERLRLIKLFIEERLELEREFERWEAAYDEDADPSRDDYLMDDG